MSLADRLVLMPEFKVRSGTTEELERAALRIEHAYPDVEKRAPEDVPKIVGKVEQAVSTGAWDGVSAGDVSVAVYAMIEGRHALSDPLRAFLEKELEVTTNTKLLDAVCRGYLATWSMGAVGTKSLCALLTEKSELLLTRWKSLFMACPEFLDLNTGPANVGARMTDAADPYVWLKGIGVPSPHGEGFMWLAHKEFLRQLPDPTSVQSVEKLLRWATPIGSPKEYGTREAEVVGKILSPWVASACPENLREFCVARLVERFGDPRTEHPAFWSQIGAQYRKVMLKWLARKSIEAIFEIVSEVEKGTEHDHQWAKRKRFWMSVYDQGRIDEAWVALGKKAIPVAKALSAQTSDPSFLGFGHQARKDTCLLFMKINDKIIVEGSHNFRVHVFPTPSRVTPELYLRAYDLEEIMLPKQHPDARVHDSAGNWMAWVQRRI